MSDDTFVETYVLGWAGNLKEVPTPTAHLRWNGGVLEQRHDYQVSARTPEWYPVPVATQEAGT